METSLGLKKFSLAKLLSASLMVFGTTVGAGMLAIPLMTADLGFSSAILVTLLVWFFMAVTGLLLLEVSFYMPEGANLMSLSARLLGKTKQWIVAALFLFLYYCLLVAYFSGGAPLLGHFFSSLWGIKLSFFTELALFVGLFGGVVALGSSSIHKTNMLLSIGMLVVYFVLVFFGSSGVSVEKLIEKPLSFSMVAIPVLFGAFGFHNIVPSLTRHLGKEKNTLRAAVLFGTFLAFIFYVTWQWLVLGSLSPDSLKETAAKGLPVTYALAGVSDMRVFALGQLFAFLALTTSFLGVSCSLVDFIRDGFSQRNKQIHRLLCTVYALSPPLLCVLINPHLFDKALGLAGGFGEAILNGILPILLYIRMKFSIQNSSIKFGEKMFLSGLFIFSLIVVFSELYIIIF